MKTLRTLLPILAVLILLGGGDYLYRQRFQEYGQGEEEDEGDQGSSLLKQCIEKGNYFVEVGNPNAPTKVVAYLPDSTYHNEAVRYLIDTAQGNPNALHIRLVRKNSAEGLKELLAISGHGGLYSRYLINGKDSYTGRGKGGSGVKVYFRGSPSIWAAPRSWTVGMLIEAVQQSVAENREAAPGLSPPVKQPPIVQLLGDKAVGEWGSRGARTKVVAYVPDSAHHDRPVKILVDMAEKNPSKLHVRIVRMSTEQGQEITLRERRQTYAAYLINGSSTVTITFPDGHTAPVNFENDPGVLGLWDPEHLRVAVEQAMAKR